MVTLHQVDNALKTIYLGVVSEQLNLRTSPFLAKIKQTTTDVCGKEIRKLAPFGVNGGISCGNEVGLPTPSEKNYLQFVSTLKNLYGQIEISDKAIRASGNNLGAFVNLLNAEMEGLLQSSEFNFGRMLLGNGTGILTSILFDNGKVYANNIKGVIEGQLVDIYDNNTKNILHRCVKIIAVDRVNKTITFANKLSLKKETDYFITIQQSYNQEVQGIETIFDTNIDTLYGLNKKEHPILNGYIKEVDCLNDNVMNEVCDYLSENFDSNINFIICSSNVKRMYIDYLQKSKINVDFMSLAGGYKAISYNGIPIIPDRFCQDNTMYMLNSNDFSLHQLCDWRWLENENGTILKQKQGTTLYNATLVKYAELMCDKPCGQAKIIIKKKENK